MAHKTASDARRARNKQPSGELQASSDNMQGGQAEHNAADSTPTHAEDQAEITGRFVGVDETDRAVTNFSKIHILKTRSSSEQNLMLKTSSLRKGQYLSSSMLYDGTEGSQNESDKLNNNLVRDTQTINKTVEVNVTVSIGTTTPDHAFNRHEDSAKIAEKQSLEHKDHDDDKECEDIVKLIKAVSNNSHTYKKNSNVYNLSQAKTVLSERRRSIPMLPKLISQKLNEHSKHLSRSVDNSELHNGSENNKDFKMKTFRTLSKGLGRLLKRHSSINISEPDPVYKVAYLGNVLTGWAKGEGCVDKPLATLWRNYNQSSKPDVVMKLSITNSGLKGITKEHGLTEYWAHRITYCASPPEFPKVFCWVYRHEGRKLKHELRCHAVLCSKESVAKKIATDLKFKIKQALFEFKRDKLAKQNARLSLANSVYENPSMPRRKILLSVGGNNYKPPLERSKSAPKLMAIEEMCSEEDEEEMTMTGERSTNTWTKDNSFKLCCQPEDIFPSYTLGRRKCDKKCYRKTLPENRFKTMGSAFRKSEGSTNNAVVVKDNERVNSELPTNDSISSFSDESKDTCDESYPYSSQRVSNSTHHVSFSFSTISESSENNPKNTDVVSDDTEDDVFYCETEERLSNQDKNQTQKDDEVSINGLDQLCAQTNFLVLDSDEGSISSGCETSSTVTSSDIEMTSLPCNFTINEFKSYPEESEKISVLERVQSFEQLFSRERSDSLQNYRSLNKGNFRYSHAGEFRTSSERSEDSDVAYSSANDSPSYSPSTDSGAVSCGDEVNLVPLGEKHDGLNLRPSYLRCATYPPSDDEANVSSFDSHEFDSRENLGEDVCGASEKGLNFDSTAKTEVEKAEEDSDSACSVESGYSELLDGGQHDCVVGSTVCV